MLVFLSDLHFTDGTAVKHDLNVNAFLDFFSELAERAAAVKAKEIIIVFLGDIFDLLRTEKWFQIPAEERPWGNKKQESRMLEHCLEIMNDIRNNPGNAAVFSLLKSDLKKTFPSFPVEPKRIFIPGNHDRLAALSRPLLKIMRDCLNDKSKKLKHTYDDPAYGVFARHGHEFDPYNYEGNSRFTENDYKKTPIGDALTTELVTRIPYTIMSHEKIKKLPAAQRGTLNRNLQQIEDVRPLSATLSWLYYQVKDQAWLDDIINESINTVLNDFNQLPFVKSWYTKHDKSYNFWDDADKLQTVLFFMKKLRITRAKRIFSFAENFYKKINDPLKQTSLRDIKKLDKDVRFLVYGHTHESMVLPLRLVNKKNRRHEQIYINTGCWGQRHIAALEGGFSSWQQLSYVIFYNKTENKKRNRDSKGPGYEIWNGVLKSD